MFTFWLHKTGECPRGGLLKFLSLAQRRDDVGKSIIRRGKFSRDTRLEWRRQGNEKTESGFTVEIDGGGFVRLGWNASKRACLRRRFPSFRLHAPPFAPAFPLPLPRANIVSFDWTVFGRFLWGSVFLFIGYFYGLGLDAASRNQALSHTLSPPPFFLASFFPLWESGLLGWWRRRRGMTHGCGRRDPSRCRIQAW